MLYYHVPGSAMIEAAALSNQNVAHNFRQRKLGLHINNTLHSLSQHHTPKHPCSIYNFSSRILTTVAQ
jgi:hypothetical protein